MSDKDTTQEEPSWLSDEELKAYRCRHLLEPPAPEVIEQWAKWTSDLRYKLAKARGILYDYHHGSKVSKRDLKRVLKETEGA